MKKVLANALPETGEEQFIGAQLIDVKSGDGPMGLPNLEIFAASDPEVVPEPSSVLLFGGGLAGLIGDRWRRRPPCISLFSRLIEIDRQGSFESGVASK